MQKLRNRILDRMIAAHLTNKEIDFLLYVSRFQDNNGHVSGIYYKELCAEMGMSFQSFYDVMESLEEKHFIKKEKCHSSDYDITILDNVYTGENYHHDGYINTNHSIFFSKDYLGMKAGAKLLAIKLMALTHAGKGEFRIGVKLFYKKYAGLFEVTKRVLGIYLMQVKRFFHVYIKNGTYHICPSKCIYRNPGSMSERQRYAEHNTETICRRHKIQDAAEKDKRDVCDLFRQYNNAVSLEKLTDAMDRAVLCSLEKLAERRLMPRLVHKLLRVELQIND